MKTKILLIFLSSLLCFPLCSADENFEQVKREYESLLTKKYILLPHKGTYLLPFSYNFNPNNASYKVLTSQPEFANRGEYNRKLEAELQVSFMILAAQDLFNTDFNLFFGYTQQSWWQVYNSAWSKPFRESNYAPELFARKILNDPINFLGGKFIAYDLGYVHQSNGQTQELSRSWDRVFIRTAFVFGNFFLRMALWYRLPEKDSKDDNKYIYNYIGHGEIQLDQISKKSKFSLRIIPGTRHPGAELMYSYPWREGLRFFAKLSQGYGLSLIDQDNEGQKIALGFVLSDFFTNAPTPVKELTEK